MKLVFEINCSDVKPNVSGYFVGWKILMLIIIMAQFTLSNAGKPTGMMGGLSRGNKSALPAENFDYVLELFPSQEFTGWWYFWASADPVTAQLQESPEVSWLAVSPASFTSDTCTDVVEVSFQFTAPSTPGIYNTTIVDQNGNWANLPVTLSVTNTPVSAWEEYVEINPGGSYTSYDTLFYDPSEFEGIGCSPVYVPPTSAEVVYTLVPQVSWLTIQPSQMTIGPTDTFIVAETFTNNTAGNYSCYEIWTAQYYAWPEFTLWNLSVLTDIVTPSTGEIPQKFELFQNYPNPFNPETTIRFQLSASSFVTIKVYDIRGQEVAILINEKKNAGEHSIKWNAAKFPSGIYYCQIWAGEYREAIKMILLK